MSTLVIRFSSLGDVVLCGAVTGGLAPVTMLTRRAWADVAARLPGVRRVIAWEDLQAGNVTLDRSWDRIVDLHVSPRSRRVCAGLRGPIQRVRRYDFLRRSRVYFKAGRPPPPVVERYAAAAGVPCAPLPWLPASTSPGTALCLVPGAAHATKRWPLERFAELAATWTGPVTVLGGPDELDVVRELVSGIGSQATGVTERGFQDTLAALRQSRVVVAGDTGLMHLAAAVGVPVLSIFGPTTSRDGFWTPSAGRAVELDLPCRPCSLHGGPVCPFGDHRCMCDLDASAVSRGLIELLKQLPNQLPRDGQESSGMP